MWLPGRELHVGFPCCGMRFWGLERGGCGRTAIDDRHGTARQWEVSKSTERKKRTS